MNISTVGLSALYLPTGKVLSELTWYPEGAMVEKVPLFNGTTPAMLLGQTFEFANMIAAIGFIFAFGIRRKRR